MKIKVKNVHYNGKVDILEFENGVAEVSKEDEKAAARIANLLGFEIVEEEKKEVPKKPSPRSKPKKEDEK